MQMMQLAQQDRAVTKVTYTTNASRQTLEQKQNVWNTDPGSTYVPHACQSQIQHSVLVIKHSESFVDNGFVFLHSFLTAQ